MNFIRLLALGLTLITAMATPASAEEAPEKIKVGLFITNLFDINFARRDVEAQFWIWFNHADAAFDPQKSIEIVNARSATTMSSYRTNVAGGGFWDQVKFSAVLQQNWKVANYPFDRQRMKIVIESAEADARKLQFIPTSRERNCAATWRWPVGRSKASGSTRPTSPMTPPMAIPR